jgi:hypothetical protein
MRKTLTIVEEEKFLEYFSKCGNHSERQISSNLHHKSIAEKFIVIKSNLINLS